LRKIRWSVLTLTPAGHKDASDDLDDQVPQERADVQYGTAVQRCVATILLIVSILATLVPVGRASAIDPAAIVRHN
jgi:hypothetical protein